ncbi:hypothetical protein K5549_018190, partial [Capra hircus]
PRLPPHPDSISRMTDVKENVPGKDPGDAESRPCKPESSGPTREDKSSLRDHPSRLRNTVNDVSKLSSEIGMNRDFHVEEKVLPPGSLEGRIRETMHDAFWEHLKERLSATPPDFNCALELLKEIKEILLSLLLPRQNRLRSEIEEALDMDLLKQEAEHGSLNVPHLSKYILNMMTLLCAPVRDEAVQKLENISDPVRLLSVRGIFQVLSLMKMDMVNYTIQSLQPQLQEHSIQFERAKFQDLLNKQPSMYINLSESGGGGGTEFLAQTRGCRSASSSACSSPSEAASSPEPLSPTMVLSQGFLNLLLWDPEDDEFPETLLTDRARLQELEAQLRQLTILASVLLVSSSFSGSVLFGSPQFVDKLKRVTKALLEEFKSRPEEEALLTVSEQVAQEIHQSLKNMGLAALSSDNTGSLIGQLQDVARKENCVRSVIDQRIHLFLKCCLVLGVQRSLLDLPGGLTLIEAELAELGQKFVSLTHHNQQVFGPYYTEILKGLLPPAQVLETEVASL